ncbi:MAG: ABC transporter permease [Acidimicrobiales bacterium]
MSAPTTERPTTPGRYGVTAVIASEWIKFRSVRSTTWSLVVTAVLGVGLGAIVTSARASHFGNGPGGSFGFDPTRASLAGVFLAQLAIGVLGVLVMSAEYSTGTIHDTFSAVPRRLWVMGAKALVFSVVTFVVGEVVAFASFFVGQSILTGKTPTASISDPSSLRAVLSTGLYLVLLGLIALGIATIVRHTAAAISTFVGTLFVLPIIAALLPAQLSSDIGRFLPAEIGRTILSTGPSLSGDFGPWVGVGLLGLYAAAILTTGAVLLVRRDA